MYFKKYREWFALFTLTSLWATGLMLMVFATPAQAWGIHHHRFFSSGLETHTARYAATGSVETAYSPDEGAEYLVIKAIRSAQHEIDIMAYGFSNPKITEALLQALSRHVQVYMAVDAKANTVEDRSGKAQSALNALRQAGAAIHLVHAYAIAHDKVMIIDQQTVETGSFNYTEAAAHRNSENVVVLWNNPAVALDYRHHFARNWSAP